MKSERKIGYRLSFIIAFSLLIIGVIVELFSSHNGVTMPQWPLNFVILSVFVVYIIGLNYFWKSDLKSWFASIKSTVGVITVYAVLVLIMGFIDQNDQTATPFVRNTGLSHLNKSWYFLFVSAYLLIILGFVILKRIKNLFKFRNFAFFLNHFGIWLVIATASLGSSDLQRLTLPILENQSSDYAFKDDTTLVELPFTVTLNDFYINNFNPNVIVFNPHNREILNEPSVNYSADSANTFKYKNWQITILKVFPNAVFDGDELIPNASDENTEFAALVKINNEDETKEVWISSGNFETPSKVAVLEDFIAVSLSLPQEKEYTSVITLTNKDEKSLENIKIEVNEPFKHLGFKIYQQGFDNINGEDVSILEIVKDPWLPVVYTGLIMLTIGSLMLFWLGKKRKNV